MLSIKTAPNLLLLNCSAFNFLFVVMIFRLWAIRIDWAQKCLFVYLIYVFSYKDNAVWSTTTSNKIMEQMLCSEMITCWRIFVRGPLKAIFVPRIVVGCMTGIYGEAKRLRQFRRVPITGGSGTCERHAPIDATSGAGPRPFPRLPDAWTTISQEDLLSVQLKGIFASTRTTTPYFTKLNSLVIH